MFIEHGYSKVLQSKETKRLLAHLKMLLQKGVPLTCPISFGQKFNSFESWLAGTNGKL